MFQHAFETFLDRNGFTDNEYTRGDNFHLVLQGCVEPKKKPLLRGAFHAEMLLGQAEPTVTVLIPALEVVGTGLEITMTVTAETGTQRTHREAIARHHRMDGDELCHVGTVGTSVFDGVGDGMEEQGLVSSQCQGTEAEQGEGTDEQAREEAGDSHDGVSFS